MQLLSSRGPMYGLQMTQADKRLKLGTIYATGRRLQKLKWARSWEEVDPDHPGLPRRYYELTEEGQRALRIAHDLSGTRERPGKSHRIFGKASGQPGSLPIDVLEQVPKPRPQHFTTSHTSNAWLSSIIEDLAFRIEMGIERGDTPERRKAELREMLVMVVERLVDKLSQDKGEDTRPVPKVRPLQKKVTATAKK